MPDLEVDSHPPMFCEGEPCPIHHPSDHAMNTWPMTVRHDKACLVERVCSHGVGHPDPDSLAWLSKGSPGLHDMNGSPVVVLSDLARALAVHGCDGCCA